jgi:phosphoribosylcarboxyaminoimidazole (NCAIR) mutase
LYFARTMPTGNILDLLRFRLEYNTQIGELGYVIVDPYTPLLDCLPHRSILTLERMDSAEAERTVLAAIEKAAVTDPYFALVRKQNTSDTLPVIDETSLLALASPEEADEIYTLDKKRVSECDVFIANLPQTLREPPFEVEIARTLGILRFAFGAGDDKDNDSFNASYPKFEELLSVLEVHNSGEGPYLTTSPVNKVRGDVLIYAIDMATLYPHILAQVVKEMGYPRRLFSFCCERSHVHELAQKLPVMLRLGGVVRITVLTKDGSPHDIQMHTMLQEVVENMGYSGQVIHCVVEHGTLHTVSAAAVKASRHLHMTDRLISHQDDGREDSSRGMPEARRKPCVGIILGGKSDLKPVEKSGLCDLLEREGITYTFDVISSDREPERLRSHCLTNAQRWDIVIAIAGGVPNLPIAVMSWVRGTPVISVPVEERVDVAAAALTTPAEAPIILTGYGERGLRKTGELVVQLLMWKSVPKNVDG